MFDVLTIGALADEFGRELIGGRVQKTIQLDPLTIGLEIYAERQRRFLIASADHQNPRVYFSSAKLSADPDRVSPLLLLLRKYVRGGQIVSVQQPPLERLIRISVAKRFWPDKDDEAGDDDVEPAEETFVDLIIEIMGRRSNIILVSDANKILDSVKRVTPEMSRQRSVLPGKPYLPPPPQTKLDPRWASPEDVSSALKSASGGSLIAGALVRAFAGFSPQMAAETVFRASGDTDTANSPEWLEPNKLMTLTNAITTVVSPLETGDWQPSVYSVDGETIAFSAIRLLALEENAEEERYPSMSGAAEHALAASRGATPARHAQRRAKLVAEIADAADRIASRVRSLEEQAERATQIERHKAMGELIYGFIHEIKPGQTMLTVEGLSIPLDADRTPSENAQEYFERYRKAQSATEHVPELMEQARTELSYLRELQTLAQLAEAIDDIEQIRVEWDTWSNRSKSDRTGKGRRQSAPKQPKPLRTARGDVLYVGHNGRQNEIVTFDLAGPDDVWLHARGLPGAHVIVRWAGSPDPQVLERAASLAAWFSSGRQSTSIEVDATERRYVRKIKGAGPGMVTYRNEQTLNVQPRPVEDLEFVG